MAKRKYIAGFFVKWVESFVSAFVISLDFESFNLYSKGCTRHGSSEGGVIPFKPKKKTLSLKCNPSQNLVHRTKKSVLIHEMSQENTYIK